MTTAIASAALLLAHTGVADGCGSRKFGISFKPRNSLNRTTQPFFHRVGCAFVTPADALSPRRQLPFAASDKVAETEPSELCAFFGGSLDSFGICRVILFATVLSEVENNDEEIEESDAEVSYDADVEQEPQSLVQILQQFYKQAIAVNDEIRIADVETQLQSIEDERTTLSQQAVCLREELATEKERLLRLNADFDNFRKRSEKERLSLASNVQAEVIERLLPIVDSFELAKTQIKIETEGEEKINNSYQSIYKQFSEIMRALGVSVVETIGKLFDPMLHDAVMREESTEFEEGIIIEEFRRGFILGDKLLRPAMVKVSAGPGPTKPAEASTEMVDASEETAEAPEETAEAPEETTQDGDDAPPSTDSSPAES